jgi:hypothetical protein
MGFLTTFTVYNDAMSSGKEFWHELAEQIMEGHYEANRHGKAAEKRIGCHCSAVKVEPSRHADHHVLYLHWGNLVHVVAPYEKDWTDLCSNNPDCAQRMINEAKQLVKAAEKQLKEAKKKA